jgi:hypothetical protein
MDYLSDRLVSVEYHPRDIKYDIYLTVSSVKPPIKGQERQSRAILPLCLFRDGDEYNGPAMGVEIPSKYRKVRGLG